LVALTEHMWVSQIHTLTGIQNWFTRQSFVKQKTQFIKKSLTVNP